MRIGLQPLGTVLLGACTALSAQVQPQGESPVLSEEESIQSHAQGATEPLTITPTTVRRVQQALQERGYQVGAVDGNWNQQTSAAVRAFQQAQGLEPSGELNTRTLGVLGIGGDR